MLDQAICQHLRSPSARGRSAGYTGTPRVRFVTGAVTGAIASAAINTTTRVVSGLSIEDNGGGYATAPTVTIVGGTGWGLQRRQQSQAER